MKTTILTLAALALMAGTAHAGDLSFNVGATTDYVARGSSQSNHQPSYSVGAEYTLDSGFYGSIWTANVDFGDGTNQEVDLAAGYRHTFKGVDVEYGIASYNYRNDPGRGADMQEAHITVSKTFGKIGTSVTAAVSPNYFNMGTRSAWFEVGASYPLTSKLTLGGGLGYQTIDRKTVFPPYSTWNLGASYALTPKVSVDLRYTASDLDKAKVGFFADPIFAVGITKSF